MVPEPIFKRKHYGTPQSMLLIMSNYIVFAIALSLGISCTINWFFWVAMGLLAVYNFFNIRKDREEYTRARVIAYVISIILMAVMFFVFRSQAQKC